MQDIKGQSSKWINEKKFYEIEISMAGRLWCILLQSFAFAKGDNLHQEPGRASQKNNFYGLV